MHDKILDEILENTKAVKTAVVKVPKEKTKRQEQTAKADKKFKKVGANFKLEEFEIINDRCKSLELNTSQYVKWLVENDLKPSQAHKEINEGNESAEPQKEPESDLKDLEIKKFEKQNNELRAKNDELGERAKALTAELDRCKGLDWLQRFKSLFTMK